MEVLEGFEEGEVGLEGRVGREGEGGVKYSRDGWKGLCEYAPRLYSSFQ